MNSSAVIGSVDCSFVETGVQSSARCNITLIIIEMTLAGERIVLVVTLV